MVDEGVDEVDEGVDNVEEVVGEVVDKVEKVVVVLIEPSSPLLSSVVASSQLADVEHFTFTCRGFALVSQLCFAIDAS